MQRKIFRLPSLGSERGSQGLEAAGAALAAALLVLALLAGARSTLGPRVFEAFQCAASALVGGGAGCGNGGAADTTGTPPEQAEESDDDDGGFGFLDGIQIGLDVVGLVPGFGEIADGVNGVISLARGDEAGAALSFGAMIPFAGWGATGAKWVRTGVKYSDEAAALANGGARYSDEVAETLRYADEAEDATGAARRADDFVPPCPVWHRPGGKGPGLAAPTAAGDCLVPGTSAHRDQRWQDYLDRKKAEGKEPLSREQWDKQYDINMEQARKAHEAAEAYRKQLGWGESEVTVDVGDGTSRRIDIADVDAQKGIEYKTGYITHSEDIRWEIERDAKLIKSGWDIEWVFEGTASKPLLDALTEAGIPYKIR